MKAYCISDNVDTQTGLRLVGIDGVVLHEKEEILKALQEKIKDPSMAIIFMTTKAMNEVADVVAKWKMNLKQPLIVEISDRHGLAKISERIDGYISSAIGLKL
ncbi:MULTISPECIES: V-type ATP synthase subunit F [Terrabacteria group]|uniref:V-type ATP synthase subunit F n=1 Tax=Bacillati TaxID=1783272 RepID=UPI00193A9F9A|nr:MULTISPECIES: V-type ATP synthase subunit F [Terrabacteria group]MBW9212317.1 V-type ATP synthase subunit F [Trueperella sp. zg.1013]QRG86146.1 V-type ATP synthase subunit F [Bulleidia sp. zg-1006]